jgi:hypothetical protein
MIMRGVLLVRGLEHVIYHTYRLRFVFLSVSVLQGVPSCSFIGILAGPSTAFACCPALGERRLTVYYSHNMCTKMGMLLVLYGSTDTRACFLHLIHTYGRRNEMMDGPADELEELALMESLSRGVHSRYFQDTTTRSSVGGAVETLCQFPVFSSS